MDRPQIIGIGLNGLVGSKVCELLKDKYEFVNLSRSNGVDISRKETLEKIKDYDSSFVIHMAAKADVDGCESDKELGEEGEAWKVNVLGTRNVAQICQETNKKMIYISTDFVFDGDKPQGESYVEEDETNGVNWYGKTKELGEKEVINSGARYMIIRPAYPYRADFKKKDFVRAIKERLEGGGEIKGVTDHVFCPTFIDDLANVLDKLIEQDESGIFHAVGDTSLTPYDAAILIANTFNLDTSLISKTTREEFFKDRAPRPFNLALKNDRIAKLGIKMRGLEEGLRAIKQQIS